ncbi:MAG: transcription termination/antitermination NusG family protein [Bacteroidetes bacterium]|nr:transcription termination/antitermination NusG family protein [Bacteroidota bacterium]
MSRETQNNQWYALYTRPRFERKIQAEIGLMNHECYLPMRNVVHQWSDRMKKVREPLFAGYIFVRTNLCNKAELLQIQGVIRFVCSDGKPETIPFQEIDRIKLIEENGKNIQVEGFYLAGDHVIVKKGVFEGLEGILIRQVNHRSRFLIRLPLLKQAISVDISMDDLLRMN